MPRSRGRAHGDVGVAGEIVVELEGVAPDGDEDFKAAVELGVVEKAVDEVVGEELGDQEFLGRGRWR